MEPQLFLLPDSESDTEAPEPARKLADRPVSWRLDEHTRTVGRQGIAQAREVLRQTLAGEAHRPARKSAA